MFDCGTPDDFRCGFDVSNSFQSGALYINRHAFERSRQAHQENHRSELSRLREVLGAGLSEEDEEDLINEGIQSANSMLRDSPPMSSFPIRRGGDLSYSPSGGDNSEPKFTGNNSIHMGKPSLIYFAFWEDGTRTFIFISYIFLLDITIYVT